ncbi:MAG: hypothetical protein Q8L66_02135 [Caulobacter sp.]|nr:hypothetical protein [Caulobacter sp.]
MTDVPIWISIAASLASGLGGILIGRLTMSKKERADVDQKNYENTVAATANHDAAYKAYVDALGAYARAADPTFDEFLRLASSGDSYFGQVSKMCDAILAGRANEGIRDASWLPKIKAAFERLLPAHYGALQMQATKKGYRYTGELRRSDHESIYAVVERYSGTDAWQRFHEG